jgi:hypothetical protein
MLVVLVVLAVVLILVGVVLAVRRGAAGANDRIEAAVSELDVVRREKAEFYGLASRGTSQARAIGTLVLTPDELVFLQMVPAEEIRVPRVSVAFAEVAQSFLGKSQGRDLLLVTFRDGSGDDRVEDRAAWAVPHSDDWRAELWTGVAPDDESAEPPAS